MLAKKYAKKTVLGSALSPLPRPQHLVPYAHAHSTRAAQKRETRLSYQEPILVADVGLTDQQTIHRNAETTKGPAAHRDARGSDSTYKDWVKASEG